jgi:hypothetical protein
MPKVNGELVPCSNGYHVCRRKDLIHWLGEAIYEVEVRGQRVTDSNKVVVSEARLLRRLDAWNDRTARLFAADCAEMVLPLFERVYPSDSRPRDAIAAARAVARGEIYVNALACAASAASAAKNAAWASDAASDAAAAYTYAAAYAADAAAAAAAAAYADAAAAAAAYAAATYTYAAAYAADAAADAAAAAWARDAARAAARDALSRRLHQYLAGKEPTRPIALPKHSKVRR